MVTFKWAKVKCNGIGAIQWPKRSYGPLIRTCAHLKTSNINTHAHNKFLHRLRIGQFFFKENPSVAAVQPKGINPAFLYQCKWAKCKCPCIHTAWKRIIHFNHRSLRSLFLGGLKWKGTQMQIKWFEMDCILTYGPLTSVPLASWNEWDTSNNVRKIMFEKFILTANEQ